MVSGKPSYGRWTYDCENKCCGREQDRFKSLPMLNTNGSLVPEEAGTNSMNEYHVLILVPVGHQVLEQSN